MEQQRPFKIDLVISRRHKEVLTTAREQKSQFQEQNVAKRSHNRKKITLTMAHQCYQKQQRPSGNPQNHPTKSSQAHISEFKLQSSHEIHREQHQELKKSTQMLASVLQNSTSEEGKEWWQYLRRNSQDERQELMHQLKSTEKKIHFFHGLISQKKSMHQAEKRQKIDNYETYITNLEKMYRHEMEQAEKICKKIQEISFKHEEDDYHNLRKNINKDGKKGLNYSPRQVSVFSGASDTILLSKGSSCQRSTRRAQLFSFGSIKRPARAVSFSKTTSSPFLDPGRACMAKRKLQFNQF